MTNSSQKTHFHVDERTLGAKHANQLRSAGKIPGNIYGLNSESQAVEVGLNEFVRLYAEEGDTGLIYLSVGESKKEVPVLIDDVNYHPLNRKIQHIVFRRVDLKQTLKAEVPVVLTGENKIPQTTIVLVTDSIEIEALPENIPNEFSIDISTLTEIGQAVTYAQLAYDRAAVSIVFAGEEDEESPVAILQEVKEEVVEEPEVLDVAEATDSATPAEVVEAEKPTE